MTEEDLEIKDDYGFTAFAYATHIGNIEMAKCLVRKNKKLVSIRSPPNNAIPLINACRQSQWEMVDYLCSLTPLEELDDRDGAALISQCFLSNYYRLLQTNPFKCTGLYAVCIPKWKSSQFISTMDL
ncbi:hypothetical protein CerSpe_241830 [Prunus speciosa]